MVCARDGHDVFAASCAFDALNPPDSDPEIPAGTFTDIRWFQVAGWYSSLKGTPCV